jgi:hypothetical protein
MVAYRFEECEQNSVFIRWSTDFAQTISVATGSIIDGNLFDGKKGIFL